jgi:hypothetical protein
MAQTSADDRRRVYIHVPFDLGSITPPKKVDRQQVLIAFWSHRPIEKYG